MVFMFMAIGWNWGYHNFHLRISFFFSRNKVLLWVLLWVRYNLQSIFFHLYFGRVRAWIGVLRCGRACSQDAHERYPKATFFMCACRITRMWAAYSLLPTTTIRPTPMAWSFEMILHSCSVVTPMCISFLCISSNHKPWLDTNGPV
jgi:hypothetical protein